MGERTGDDEAYSAVVFTAVVAVGSTVTLRVTAAGRASWREIPVRYSGGLDGAGELYRGEWGTGKDGTTGVGLGGRFFFNPFYLVDAQLNEGESASVAAFFAAAPVRGRGGDRRL